MFVLSLVFLAVLAVSTGQADFPQYAEGQWIVSNNLQYDEADEQFLAEEELPMWAPSSPEEPEVWTLEDQDLSLTPESPLTNEQESSKVVEDSAVWKIVLVVSVLLVFVVGSLSVAYYLYVWRGGRIYYQPQKEGSA